jgi:DNA-binding MarR family transcriptional regulator
VPVTDRLDDEAIRDWELIRRVVANLDQRILADLATPDLPEQAFSVLHALLHAPQRRLSMTQLARHMLMSSGGFTKLADRLGSAGLIDRRGSEGDRRVVFAALTEEGVRLARLAERRYHAALRAHLFRAITPEQLHTVAAQLGVLDDEAGADLTAARTERDPNLPDRRKTR